MSEDMAVGDSATVEEAIIKGDGAVALAPEAGDASSQPPSEPAPQIEEPAPSEEASSMEIEPKPMETDDNVKTPPVEEQETAQVVPDSGNVQEENAEVSEPANRGIKRRVSSDSVAGDFKGFEDVAQDEEELKGFESVNEKDVSVDYRKVIERLEPEVSAATQNYTFIKVLSATLPQLRASKRPRQDTSKSTDASRPSSAQSSRSDDGGLLLEVAASSPAQRGGRRATTEMSSPLLRVPLDKGWKRELVYRAALDPHQRRNADIYYYTPQGKKLRSSREVAEHLSGTGLTLENFSFWKEPLGVDDPEREIIRDAKMMRKMESPVTSPAPIAAEGKRTPKPKPPKGASPEPVKSPPTKIRVKSVGSRLSGNSAAAPKQNAKKAAADNNNSAAWKKPRQPGPEAAPAPPALRDASGALHPAGMTSVATMAVLEPSTSYGIASMGTSSVVMPSISSAPVASAVLIPSPPPLTHSAPQPVPLASSMATLTPLPSSASPMLTLAPLPVAPRTPPPLQSRPQTQLQQSPDIKSPQQLVQPCSMTCGLGVPTLSCAACLCMYHPACVGLHRPPPASAAFYCANCRKSTSPPREPPPLIHKSGVLGSVSTPAPRRVPAPTAAHPPKQDKKGLTLRMKVAGGGPDGERVWAVAKPQSIPKPQPVPIPRPAPVPKAQPAARPAQAPSPRTIAIIRPASQPQSMAVINGKRYIVVPRNLVQSGPNEEKRTRGKLANGAASPDALLSPRRRGRARNDDTDHFTAFYNRAQEHKYNVVVQIFQYLGMRELAVCARVCRLWRTMAATAQLWRHVRMKNSHVSDWGGLCAALKRHGTVRLDLRKMLLPQNDTAFWTQFADHIPTVDTLERIEMCRCPATAVEAVCRGLPNLKSLSALAIRDALLDPAPLATLRNLHELRLKSMNGLSLTRDLRPLADLKNLQHLSLTSIKELGWSASDIIGQLSNLESLELGECTFAPEFAGVLGKLKRLRRLRLERGTAQCAAPQILRALATLPLLTRLELVNIDVKVIFIHASTHKQEIAEVEVGKGHRTVALATLPLLTRLELVNIDVKVGFDDALAECKNIQRLLIIPTYVSQSATTNKQVLSGVLRLKDTLTHLMWGVTIELLRVTELFIDQCEQAGERPPRELGECIPVLKPVPGFKLPDQHHVQGPPQVEILPLPTLQRLLSAQLPHTKLKLLRIPFHATWRQTLADFQ